MKGVYKTKHYKIRCNSVTKDWDQNHQFIKKISNITKSKRVKQSPEIYIFRYSL